MVGGQKSGYNFGCAKGVRHAGDEAGQLSVRLMHRAWGAILLKRVMLYAVAAMSLATSGAVVYLLAAGPEPIAIQPAPTVTVTVTPSETPSSSPAAPELSDYYVTAETCLNVRSEPALDSLIIDCIPHRDSLEGTGPIRGWIKVKVASGWGYASATYLSTEQPPAPPPPPARPNGSVTYDPDAGGQGFPSGRCANWTVKWVNNSNAEVTQIVFAPPGASYRVGGYGSSGREYAAKKPRPAVLNVSIPAHSSQLTRFQTCTTTKPPSKDADFSAHAPGSFSWTWATGHRGSACYHFGC